VFIHFTRNIWWTKIAPSVQDAAAVFDEFAKVVFKGKHPLDSSTVKVFGKEMHIVTKVLFSFLIKFVRQMVKRCLLIQSSSTKPRRRMT